MTDVLLWPPDRWGCGVARLRQPGWSIMGTGMMTPEMPTAGICSSGQRTPAESPAWR